MGWLGPDATSVVNPTEVELLVYFALVFSFVLGIVHTNQTAMCLKSPKQRGRLAP